MNQFDYNNSGAPEINLRKFRPIIITVIALIVLFFILKNSFVILEPTERGVIFYKYGNGLDVENVYSEGMTVMAPWNDMYRFDVSEAQEEETMQVLSQDGLNIDVDVSIRFRPVADNIGKLYQRFRKDYKDRFVIPELRSAVRNVVGNYKPEELYSTKRIEIESEIKEIMVTKLLVNDVIMEELLLKSIKLPDELVNSIEIKLKEEQNALRYKYVLQKEQKEAERKKIEASGAALANSILDRSLTDNLLRMRGIEATLELSQSKNSKVVIVGSGKNGLPLILGGNK